MQEEKNDFVITPWDVEGKIDYLKLIERFGTSRLTKELIEKLKSKTKSKKLHQFFRREFIYSHRDFEKIIDNIDKNNFFVYTGRGPSGNMHIGHLISFITAKWFQDEFGCNVYIMVSDDEKFCVKPKLLLKDVELQGNKDIEEIIGLGFDPDKTFVFKDIEFIKQLYRPALEFAKKTNFSTAKAVFGFNNESNLGHMFYPNIQVAPTTFETEKFCLIPAGIDQDPYWRIQRDVAEKLGYKKTIAIHNKLIPPLQGVEGKMSSSDESTAIYLTDDEKTVVKKINKYAFSGGQPSVEEQRKKGGNTDTCVVYSWLDILFEEDDKLLKERQLACRDGKILCGECKKYLADKINNFLKNHKENKEKNKKQITKFMHTGCLAKKMWIR